MFSIAILIGIYSYIIFSLGLLGLFYKQTILISTIFFVLIVLFFAKDKLNISRFKIKIKNVIKEVKIYHLALFILILFQLIVNLMGALGPELGFDALWYHLTIPKIYLNNHLMSFIPGGLLYYSVMPKLTEMLYIFGLTIGTEISAKFIHFSFGILSLIALYKVSRKFLSTTYSLLAVVMFYSNLVVGWMSITAYVDLARTFFEIMALWAFLEWQEKMKTKWLILSAMLLGLAVSTKLLAMVSLLVFSALIIAKLYAERNRLIIISKSLAIYWGFTLFIVMPWLVFSFLNTNNPFYPFFSNIYNVGIDMSLLNPFRFLYDSWVIFTKSSDPILSIYAIFLVVSLILIKKMNRKYRVIMIYSFLAFLVWYFTPRSGGGRFILPYLPAFSIVSVVIIQQIKNIKIRHVFIGLVIFFSLFSITYRGAANLKYIPVILGWESKSEFLSSNLNFSYGDFYDTDKFFEKKIKQSDTVLLYGFHNLYYVNFPFIDSSYVKKGDKFNYVAVLGDKLPERFKMWNLIYFNSVTKVKLYSIGGLRWTY
ncbi:MAG: glycosyltransferase family 39 protein [Candidatus Levybacteria bacterium]|nr:glycosyltransferase family 39 protein [Candidatus Levybacteria bacterium]